MPLFDAVGDRLGQANIHKALGDVALRQNNYGAARAAYRQALALGAAIGDFASQLNSLAGLVRVERVESNGTAACDYCQQLMALAASHPAFAHHPVLDSLRKEFADLDCE